MGSAVRHKRRVVDRQISERRQDARQRSRRRSCVEAEAIQPRRGDGASSSAAAAATLPWQAGCGRLIFELDVSSAPRDDESAKTAIRYVQCHSARARLFYVRKMNFNTNSTLRARHPRYRVSDRLRCGRGRNRVWRSRKSHSPQHENRGVRTTCPKSCLR